ncbi:MAG: putative oxidoreductase C-terminal domain-containing protein [Deltaproteobacteria bacterium]|nr:putative oxidoreductase C-terminal domain-containing protein [Deltaproteobacteria bacterium]
MSSCGKGRLSPATGAILMFALSMMSLAASAEPSPPKVQLVTIAPGHFHAALVQKTQIPGVSNTVHVYGEPGFDLAEHIKRVGAYNSRIDSPTQWTMEIHAASDFVIRMKAERAGNVAVISGRNRGKLDLVKAALEANMHVLVDKPWIIEASDFPQLAAVLSLAESKHLIAADIMTERFEVTNALAQALVASPDVFGTLAKGSPERPSIYFEDVHHFMKWVSGRPNVRPDWFFDSTQQGEGLADTGTHLVDLVQWMLAPARAIPLEEIVVLSARRWPTRITPAQFESVTGTKAFPAFLAGNVKQGALEVFANTQITYRIAGIHVSLAAMWDWEAKPGSGDWKSFVITGSQSRIEVRQGAREKYRSELFVRPVTKAATASVGDALRTRIAALSDRFPGLTIEQKNGEFRVAVPDALRSGHEAHFAEVTRVFLDHVKHPATRAAWENANLLSKYFTTTAGTTLSQTMSTATVTFRRKTR